MIKTVTVRTSACGRHLLAACLYFEKETDLQAQWISAQFCFEKGAKP